MKLLEEAYELVSNFRRYDLISKTFNEFPLKDYRVPKVDGIKYIVQGKTIDKVKPSTLEYIIYFLHNADADMVFEAIVVLLYYYKVKKKEPKKMLNKYKLLIKHFQTKHRKEIPLATVAREATVYSISFDVGAVRVNKFGLTSDEYRYKKLISDIKSKYPFVSVGNFTVNQEIEFDTTKQAEIFEDEALKNLKKHTSYSKCKFCFDGYKESYLHVE